MKNIDIDKLNSLPKKQPINVVNAKKAWKYWNSKDPVYKKIDGKWPWQIVERVLKKYKGKNVDVAFSYYCKIVDKCQQFLFWREVERHLPHGKGRYWNVSVYPYWYVDNNKNIQYYKPKKQKAKHVIYSHDHKYGWVHKHTGLPADEEKKPRWLYRNFFENNDNYEWATIEGQVFTFDRKDNAFHRCFAEQLAQERKAQRVKKKAKEQKIYDFITDKEKKEKEEKIKSKENDIIVRDAHGFTDESFTNKNNRLNEHKQNNSGIE